ncbi:MAG TPA: HRDC domain-containing protein [Desulfotignum sp.]|nr:HRDC domain-containing protein [Desulfotignum sp.]
MLQFTFIASDTDLASACDRISKHPIIGVDLEADSMHSFKEKICLIQIATGDEAFLVDPFTIDNFSPFVQILENPDIIKVFHGADFDVRSLDREMGARIENLFDTEIACRFLNVRERGLAALLKAHFDVYVDKKFQKQDWSKRPLKSDMVAYSVGDVAYLIALHTRLVDSLAAVGRLHWAKEECEAQALVRYENNHAPPFFKKFKGAGKLDNRSLAVLEHLLAVRMDMAEKKDVPLFKIMSNQSLLAMANSRPASAKEMVAKKMLSKRQAQMYGELCQKAISRAMALPHKELPSYPRTVMPKKTPAVMDRINALKKLREKKSVSLGMEPGFLFNNSTITDLALEKPATMTELDAMGVLRNWQKDVLGEAIVETLARCG